MNAEPEAAQELELFALRRWGYKPIHLALAARSSVNHGLQFGFPVEYLHGPVSAVCGAKLLGNLLSLPDEHLFPAIERGELCKVCQLTSKLVLAQPVDEEEAER